MRGQILFSVFLLPQSVFLLFIFHHVIHLLASSLRNSAYASLSQFLLALLHNVLDFSLSLSYCKSHIFPFYISILLFLSLLLRSLKRPLNEEGHESADSKK
jgi:hypothetical protein